MLLRFPSFIDENELVTTMIRDNATSGQPGYFFDMEVNGYLAISLLPEPDAISTRMCVWCSVPYVTVSRIDGICCG